MARRDRGEPAGQDTLVAQVRQPVPGRYPDILKEVGRLVSADAAPANDGVD
jgi:hypothetical protein